MAEAEQIGAAIRFVPVTCQGNTYVEAPEASALAPEATWYQYLNPYISRHHQQQEATVMLKGALYKTIVYVPKNENDFSYVLVDDDDRPSARDEKRAHTPPPPIDDYLNATFDKVSKTEALYPDQTTYVLNQFVRPTLESVAPTLEREVLEWNQLQDIPRFVMVGLPGSGKTTCLRRLVLELIQKATTDDSVIPIYVELRQFADRCTTDYSLRALVASRQGLLGTDAIHTLCAGGRLALFLDGMDELPEDISFQIMQSLESSATRYPRLKICVATRPPVPKEPYFQSFWKVHLRPFSLPQIREWCSTHFLDKTSWSSFIEHVEDRPDVAELISNPLLLSIATSLFRRYSILPTAPSELYRTWTKALLSDWDAVRGICRGTESVASPSVVRTTLRRIAFQLLVARRSEFDANDLARWMAEEGTTIDATRVLSSISAATGLVTETSCGNWTISYRGMKDFFCALYLVESTRDVSKLIEGKIAMRSWHRPLELSCALTTDCSILVSAILGEKSLSQQRKGWLIANALADNVSISEKVAGKCAINLSGCLEQIRFGSHTHGKSDRYLTAFLRRISHVRSMSVRRFLSDRLELSSDSFLRHTARLIAAPSKSATFTTQTMAAIKENVYSMSSGLKGTVKWFNGAKGYGFISHQNGADVFVHSSAIRNNRNARLSQGEAVDFDLLNGPDGPVAENVRRRKDR
jgi:CspA family cold shock protein